MSENLNKYSFRTSGKFIRFGYSRTTKDWLDLLILTLFGIGSLSVSGFLIIQSIRSEFSWLYVVLISLFGFVGVIKLIEFLSRLSEPTNSIITIDKHSNTIIIRKPHFRVEKFLISELDSIEYRLHTDFMKFSNQSPKRRYWIEVHIKSNDNRRIKALNINPSEIIDRGSENTKRDLFKTAKPLISELANNLSIKSIYKGVIDEERN